MGKLPYELIFAPEIADHLNAIDAKHHALILRKIDEHLAERRLTYEECLYGRGEIAI